MPALTSSIVVTHLSGVDEPHLPLTIRGRASGLVGWLLTTLKLSPDVEFVLGDTEVSIRAAGLQGVTRSIVPLTQVASTLSGYHKPLWALAVAAVALFQAAGSLRGSAGAMLAYLVVAGGALAWYALKQTAVLTVETTGGAGYGLAFSRSVIEGVRVDLDTAERMAARLNRQVVAATLRERAALRLVA
jgi:hypothetical protein